MLIWPVELPLLLTVGPRALLEPGAPELLDGASLNKLANDKRKKKKCNILFTLLLKGLLPYV